jgi:hypothetical protein
VVASVEGDRDIRPLQVLRGGRLYCHDLPGGELLLPPWIIGVETIVDVVELLMSFGEVDLRVLVLLVLLGLFGHLEDFIGKPLLLIAVLSFVLSLWVENANLV